MTTNGTTTNGRRLKRLTARNATVTAASVTIKTLTIDRRQVTLATFRQIKGDIFDYDGNLLGVGWGWVNYCPGKQCDAPVIWMERANLKRPWLQHPYEAVIEHDHLLWQAGSELVRCAVVPTALAWHVNILERDSKQLSDEVAERYTNNMAALRKLDQLFIAT